MDKTVSLRNKLLMKAKHKMLEKFESSELHIIRAVNLQDSLEATLNLLKEHAGEIKLLKSEKLTEQVKDLDRSIQLVEAEKKSLEAFIDKTMNEELPNFSALAGPVIGAKMLSEAGSLKRLAMLPSSTIQLLGAEKALFEHLKEGKKCPKHGYLFNHSLVRKVGRKSKGKAARAIAGKLSIAAKIDYFNNGKKNISEQLNKELNERLKQIK